MSQSSLGFTRIGIALLFLGSAILASPQLEDPLLTAGESQALRTSLTTIIESIAKTEAELREKQKVLNSDNGTGRQEELASDIAALSSQLNGLKRHFSEIATIIDLNQFDSPKDAEPLTWDEELKSLLNPLIHSLVQLTSGPREIEQLREQIHHLEEQRSSAEKGLRRLGWLSETFAPKDGESDAEVSPLTTAIETETLVWEARRDGIDTQLTIAGQRLKQYLSEKSSIGESLHNLFNLFFRSRGRNLLVAFGGMLGFWLIAYRIFLFIQSIQVFQRIRKSFKFRLFNVLFALIASLGGVFTFLFVLFLFGDWLLLTLGLLTLLGIAWTSKQAIANYWTQMILLLNIGPVREGERIIFNGLPWLVRNLNFYTQFENPLLDSGQLRLPISDIQNLRSKPFDSEEPWFPTRKNDWVLLSDGTHGKIIAQTPEFVRLVRLGSSFQSYPTTDFLGMAPQVLSQGFRCSVSFGLDYQNQAAMTEAIPQKMQTHIQDQLVVAGYAADKFRLAVELEMAASSSLNLAIIADFDGDYASDYQKLQRRLQKFGVEACNHHGWNIPFPQLTLHMEPTHAGENTLASP